MASQLPPAITQFTDANGVPLAGGFLFFYAPNTTTPQTVWGDAAQTIALTNPIVLNAAGQPQNGTSQTGVYGSGVYRQLLQDSNGNQIWDSLTTDPNTSPGNADIVGNLTVGGLISGTTLSIASTSAFTGLANFENGIEGSTIDFTGAGSVGSLTVNGTSAYSGLANFSGAYSASGSGYLVQAGGGSAYTGSATISIECSNGILAASFFAVSDARLKTEVMTISPMDGEAFVTKSRPVTFMKDSGWGAGLVAQEQHKAGYPVVLVDRAGLAETVDDDGFVSPADVAMTVDYDSRIAYLIAALQSALARISALEAKETGKP